MRQATLVAVDNGVCQSQAQFTRVGKNAVTVVAAIGASQFVDETVSLEKARTMWRDLRKLGWCVPARTPVLTLTELRGIIYR